ncbi:MAG: hypothetical protein V3U87_10220 [Methylococcaceae bacterium]
MTSNEANAGSIPAPITKLVGLLPTMRKNKDMCEALGLFYVSTSTEILTNK